MARVRKKSTAPRRRSAPPPEAAAVDDAFDAKVREEAATTEQHAKITKWFLSWQMEAQEWNNRARRDRDYYDNIQWTDDELRKLAKRGQPALTFNHIAPKINFVLGTEEETRGDPHAYPRTRFHDEDAEAVTDAIRYLGDEAEFNYLASEVADNTLIEGAGGEVFGVTPVVEEGPPEIDPTTGQPVLDAETGQPVPSITTSYRITETQVPWHQFWFDVRSSKPDFTDALYLGTAVWWDVDEARGDVRYADAGDVLEHSRSLETFGDDVTDKPEPQWFDTDRKRVLILECYYKQWSDEDRKVCWYGAHLTGGGFLIKPFKIPFVDDKGAPWCPMWMVSGFVRGRTNERYGIVRSLVGPQDLVNKMHSKLMHELNVHGVIAEQGAILDKQGFLTELAKPDSMAIVEDKALQDGRIQFRSPNEKSMGHFQLLQEGKSAIERIGPNIQSIQGAQDKLSGRAFIAMQQAGSKEVKPIFSNLKKWRLGSARRRWWLIRRYWDNEMWFRVRDDERGFRFVALNKKTTRGERFRQLLTRDNAPEDVLMHAFGPSGQRIWGEAQAAAQQMLAAQAGPPQDAPGQPMPPGAPGPAPAQPPSPPNPQALKVATLQALLQTPEAQQPFTANDVARLNVDIVLDEGPQSVVAEHEQAMELLALARSGDLPRTPEITAEIIQSMHLRNKSKIVKLLMKPPDPAQQQTQMATMQAELAQLHATVKKLLAESAEAQARAQLANAQAAAVPAKAQLDVARAEEARADAATSAHQAHLNTLQTHHELAQPPGGPGPR